MNLEEYNELGSFINKADSIYRKRNHKLVIDSIIKILEDRINNKDKYHYSKIEGLCVDCIKEITAEDIEKEIAALAEKGKQTYIRL